MLLERQISEYCAQNKVPETIPPHIQENINPKFILRPYQRTALARFRLLMEGGVVSENTRHLLFHMATGSGKTLVMAALILDLYVRGYRHFVFFVNRNNIIEKTRDNFLNATSSKFLFSDKIIMENQVVRITEVDNFESVHPQDISILFTTIQGMHSRLNMPKENAITYDDFKQHKVVLISDEAHHINAETKKGNTKKQSHNDPNSWESTVQKLYAENVENILLEFTATAELHHTSIHKKYQDKLIFDYPLRQFRKDKYSKEVKVLQADMKPMDRALLAVVISQYRRKILEKNGLVIKPVILLKSKTIKESRSFFIDFCHRINSLQPSDIKKILQQDTMIVLKKVGEFLEERKITLADFVTEIQIDFSRDRCIAVDSANDSVEKQLILNSLEDHDNEYRVVFAVDKLNEGWDVLNLFDIVRLYDTQSSKTNQRSTQSEVQLIGRGARYCPFSVPDNPSLYKRKYDDNIQHELRIAEELYYHAAHNPTYIAELGHYLQEIGLQSRENVATKKRKTTTKKKIVTQKKKKKRQLKDITMHYTLPSGQSIMMDDWSRDVKGKYNDARKEYPANEFDISVRRKAVATIPFYRFDNLRNYFPEIKSVHDFLTKKKYLGSLSIVIKGKPNQLQSLSPENQLNAMISTYQQLAERWLASSEV